MPRTRDVAGAVLRCGHSGHFEWADFELRPLPESGTYALWTYCDLPSADGTKTGHYLREPAHGSFEVSSEPFGWPSAGAAFAARDRYAAMQERGGR